MMAEGGEVVILPIEDSVGVDWNDVEAGFAVVAGVDAAGVDAAGVDAAGVDLAGVEAAGVDAAPSEVVPAALDGVVSPAAVVGVASGSVGDAVASPDDVVLDNDTVVVGVDAPPDPPDGVEAAVVDEAPAAVDEPLVED